MPRGFVAGLGPDGGLDYWKIQHVTRKLMNIDETYVKKRKKIQHSQTQFLQEHCLRCWK